MVTFPQSPLVGKAARFMSFVLLPHSLSWSLFPLLYCFWARPVFPGCPLQAGSPSPLLMFLAQFWSLFQTPVHFARCFLGYSALICYQCILHHDMVWGRNDRNTFLYLCVCVGVLGYSWACNCGLVMFPFPQGPTFYLWPWWPAEMP